LEDFTPDFFTGLEAVGLDLEVDVCGPACSAGTRQRERAKLVRTAKHAKMKSSFFNKIVRTGCDFTLKLRKFYIDFLRRGIP
jgi:hypothetical protein